MKPSIYLLYYKGQRSAEGCECEENGLVCTEEGLENHNTEVDTSDEVKDLIQQLGGQTSAHLCDTSWGFTTDTPVLDTNNGQCFTSGQKAEFSCARKPSSHKKRLCYCPS